MFCFCVLLIKSASSDVWSLYWKGTGIGDGFKLSSPFLHLGLISISVLDYYFFQAVQEKKLPANEAIIREIALLVRRLPVMDFERFDEEFGEVKYYGISFRDSFLNCWLIIYS